MASPAASSGTPGWVRSATRAFGTRSSAVWGAVWGAAGVPFGAVSQQRQTLGSAAVFASPGSPATGVSTHLGGTKYVLSAVGRRLPRGPCWGISCLIPPARAAVSFAPIPHSGASVATSALDETVVVS